MNEEYTGGMIRRIIITEHNDTPIITRVELPNCELVCILTVVNDQGEFHTAYLKRSQVESLIGLLQRTINPASSKGGE